jgi:rubredoxin
MWTRFPIASWQAPATRPCHHFLRNGRKFPTGSHRVRRDLGHAGRSIAGPHRRERRRVFLVGMGTGMDRRLSWSLDHPFQIHAVKNLISRPWRSFKTSRTMRRVLEARYRQSLRCNTCGHLFDEIVVNTSRGWLEYDGARRTCPSCGSETQGFQSLGSIPLNRAAEKLGPL